MVLAILRWNCLLLLRLTCKNASFGIFWSHQNRPPKFGTIPSLVLSPLLFKYSNILIQLSHNEFGQPAGITPLEGVLSLEKYNSR